MAIKPVCSPFIHKIQVLCRIIMYLFFISNYALFYFFTKDSEFEITHDQMLENPQKLNLNQFVQ